MHVSHGCAHGGILVLACGSRPALPPPLAGIQLGPLPPLRHGPPAPTPWHARLIACLPCTPPVCSAGVVTTLVTPGQLPALQSMAAELGITIAELPPPPPELLSEGSGAESDLDTARRGLEDLFNLY